MIEITIGGVKLDVEAEIPTLEAMLDELAYLRQLVERLVDAAPPAITFRIGPVSEQTEED